MAKDHDRKDRENAPTEAEEKVRAVEQDVLAGNYRAARSDLAPAEGAPGATEGQRRRLDDVRTLLKADPYAILIGAGTLLLLLLAAFLSRAH